MKLPHGPPGSDASCTPSGMKQPKKGRPEPKEGPTLPQTGQNTFSSLAALLAIKPGGQDWQVVTKKASKKPNTEPLNPAKNSPLEARRFILRRNGLNRPPQVAREDIIVAKTSPASSTREY
ncbi:hypothetical protein ACJ73_09154 [Blastomyces percursus]|uniref:Uncharacterized protein n=1 Tax=Blastomyces percursus TaxID=1658174 RepID=A0A1J9PCY7_9EURO|nr:hypothetical protein ACJ73_09154 [Blastomyces percursus]